MTGYQVMVESSAGSGSSSVRTAATATFTQLLSTLSSKLHDVANVPVSILCSYCLANIHTIDVKRFPEKVTCVTSSRPFIYCSFFIVELSD